MSRFRLHSVLKYRKLQEDKQKQLLAEALKRIAEITAEREVILKNIGIAKERYEKTLSMGIIGLYYGKIHNDYIEQMNLQRQQTERELEEAEKNATRQRISLRNASTKRKTLEILRDKARQHQDKTEKSIENATMNEIATIINSRSNKEKFYPRNSNEMAIP